MRKFLFFICLIASNVLTLNGQNRNSGTISGIIIDNQTKKPVEFATIVIQKKTDDTVIDGTVTDSNGKFIFKTIANGEYYISYSFIGYIKKSSPPFILDTQHKIMNLGELFLESSVQELNNVEVSGEKSTFTNSIDRKTFNVGKDIMTTSGTASELMQHIPSLQVDIEGNVSLRGSGNVLILINGRPSSLMGANRAAVLQQMPANTIGAGEILNMKKTLNSLQHISMYLLRTMNLISNILNHGQKNRRITIILLFTKFRRYQEHSTIP